ncbi:helix-turn-helix transcriptional regulator [Acinetobacter sp. C_4_1]|uniref:LexA family transcriptional regulator n=1 Tax=unclassified Acinetobacter TaxID=196816 RepID=UPI0021B7A680|nr:MULTISPECIES: S24 family peptidase [unclassified Acinetobacter]MCT8090693.1 helix-turn-helix transcriptional regulator [Acinetobacter sp. F_3_1]MCT8101575.1 helix-turn-helix transcriptional regulator [Acinetobacter sp. C_4_1]MCT8135090.1 helix-turn-helix transcriptional regulator [Acinetobacter sp. T_3_1]
MHPSMSRLYDISGAKQPSELATILLESAQTISNWSKRGVSKAGAIKASALFNVSVNWILLGEDTSDSNTDVISHQVTTQSTANNAEYAEIPYFKEILVSCGSGTFNDENVQKIQEKVTCDIRVLKDYHVDPSHAVAFTAFGDSMSPTINDGSIVYVNLANKRILDGKIYAICYGNLFKFKALYNLPYGGVRIVSLNPVNDPEIILTGEQLEAESFEIIGHCFFTSNRLP